MLSLHQRSKELFLDALTRPHAERAAFLDEACARDEDLRREVDSLLSFHDEDDEAADAPSAPVEGTGVPRFSAGQVVASRYRIIARLRPGGMGGVWRPDRLGLGAPAPLHFLPPPPP